MDLQRREQTEDRVRVPDCDLEELVGFGRRPPGRRLETATDADQIAPGQQVRQRRSRNADGCEIACANDAAAVQQVESPRNRRSGHPASIR